MAAKVARRVLAVGRNFGIPTHDMTCATFKTLHQRHQAEHLAHHGHALAERTEDSFRLSLYALENFYAEIWRSAGEEAILFIHVFEQPSGLSDYLALVRLPNF